jgi:hypothetical protein
MTRYYLHPGESQFKTIMIKQVYDECYAFKYRWNSSSIWHLTVVCEPTSLWSSVAKIRKNARLGDIKNNSNATPNNSTIYVQCNSTALLMYRHMRNWDSFKNHTGYLKANFKPENSEANADKIWHFLIDAILKLILFFSDGSKVENVDSSAAIQRNCTWH